MEAQTAIDASQAAKEAIPLALEPIKWITYIALGGLLGVLGQGIRVIIGLKKLKDKATEESVSFAQLFETSTLVVSLFIGFIAGALASLALVETIPSRQVLLGFMAAGYAGTDFIEGFVKKYLPGGKASPATRAPAFPEPDASPDEQQPPATG